MNVYNEAALAKRFETGETPITHAEGVLLAKTINAVHFTEISTLDNINLNQLVDLACLAALQERVTILRKIKICNLL